MTDSDTLVEAHTAGLTDEQISQQLRDALTSSTATVPIEPHSEENNGHQKDVKSVTAESGSNGHTASQPEKAEKDPEPIAPEPPGALGSQADHIRYNALAEKFAREHQAWAARQTDKGLGNKADAGKMPTTTDITRGPIHQGPTAPARPATAPGQPTTGFGTVPSAPRPTSTGPVSPTSIK